MNIGDAERKRRGGGVLPIGFLLLEEDGIGENVAVGSERSVPPEGYVATGGRRDAKPEGLRRDARSSTFGRSRRRIWKRGNRR